MKKYIILLSIISYTLWSCGHNNSGHAHDHNDHDHSHEEHSLDEDQVNEEQAEEHHCHDHETEEPDHHKEDDSDEHDHEGHDHEGHNHDAHGTEEDDHDHSNDESSHIEAEDHKEETGFAVEAIKPQSFNEIIHTSGQILSAQGDEYTITAIHSGHVIFSEKLLLSGKSVRHGELLLSISGKELIHDNIEAGYVEAKTAYENAKQEYDRALELNKEKIISDREFQNTKLKYEKASNNYQLIKKHYSTGGQRVSASVSGYVKDVFVSEGEFVTTGQPLLKITKNKRLVVKADVPQRFFPRLKEIQSANFVTVYDDKIYDIVELNGRLISYGKTTETNNLFTPVYFEIDNVGNLLAGSFVEVYLKTISHPNSIVVPKSALMEELGRYYVYVEEHDEEFKKRYVTVDCHDGLNYHITEGLKAGEKIATENPYQIKLASLTNALPAHAHSH